MVPLGDLSGHLLKRRVEVVGAGQRGIDVIGAEHLAPHGEALPEKFALIFGAIGYIHHGVSPPGRD